MNKRFSARNQPEGMSIRTKARITFATVIVITIFLGLIAWPYIPPTFPGSSFFSRYYPHLGLDLQGGTHLVYETDLSQIAAGEKDSALEGARDVIERRVNALGVAEPVVQTTTKGSSKRIIIELAGVQDVNEAIKIIGETPLLEFKETSVEVKNTEPEDLASIEQQNIEAESKAQDIIGRINNGENFETLASEFSDDAANKESGGDLGWVGRGLFTPLFEAAIFDELGVGELRATPLKTEFGYHVIKKIDERKTDDGSTEVHAAHILIKTDTINAGDSVQWVNTELSGKQLKRAQVVFDPQTNQPQVSLTFNNEGADLFKVITERNLQKPVGIFLDGSVISAPTVQSIISGGQALISGNFTLPEAKTLVQRLNAGALPVPINLISQQTIGASLGADSLAKSLFAGVIGLSLVIVFMVLYYFIPGILSVLALIIYAIVAIALFELIPITLTLAGIAGFILSIGMAVDANVLIFERIREELRDGTGFKDAIETGFMRAWPSIRDSNISSLITCTILYLFGASIIRGFAVTLGIGILVSMFSAITVTRTFLRLLVDKKFGQKYILFGIKKVDHEV